jgi:uncharacterized protein (TIGR03437 family)
MHPLTCFLFTSLARVRYCFLVFLSTTLLMSLLGSATHLKAQQPTWNATGPLGTARVLHTSTLLGNGKVLVTGGVITGGATASAELYDPAIGQWGPTGSLGTPRYNHVAVLLPSGKILIAGGEGSDRSNLNSAELYDPVAGTWSPTGSLNAARELATLTLLPNGKALIAGGEGPNNEVLNTAEVYDPATGTWSSAGTMNAAREGHAATLLPNGKVLLASGFGGTLSNATLHSSAELYDPATGSWTPTGSLGTARPFLKAILLPNGQVLAVGGSNFTSTVYNTAELYDPATGQWSATGSMTTPRQAHTLTLLASGKVLAVGNTAGQKKAELYDPATGSWTATADLLSNVRLNHTATLLGNGKVLVSGGNGPLASAELFDSGTFATASVSAASFSPAGLAAEAIVSAFGLDLANTVAVASTLPLPTDLAGTTVRVRDSLGIERLAPLFFVASGQINYQIPPDTASGTAMIIVRSGSGAVSIGAAQIERVAPGLFTFTSDGQGVPAAIVRRFRNNQELPSVLSAQLDGQNRWVALPVDLGPESDLVILEMFGTGFRHHSQTSVTIGGAQAQVFYAGLAPGFVGLDQLDIVIPRSLAGRGEVEIVMTVDGKAANTVRVNIR